MSAALLREPDDSTARLALFRPASADVDALHSILSDPAVWAHYPSLRHTTTAQTIVSLERWISAWQRDGLGTWVAREHGSHTVVGYGGCSLLNDQVWNLGYRFAAASHGRGFATELARRAIDRARKTAPAIPVIAYLVEHNAASAAVAKKVGLTLVHRGPDRGNPDANAIRLIYADRALSDAQRAAAQH